MDNSNYTNSPFVNKTMKEIEDEHCFFMEPDYNDYTYKCNNNSEWTIKMKKIKFNNSK